MLRKDRNQVFNDIIMRLKNDINHLQSHSSSFQVQTNGHYWSDTGYYGSQQIPGPNGIQGWPPELEEYIKRVVLLTAIAIVDNIYTEDELDERVDRIILDQESSGL